MAQITSEQGVPREQVSKECRCVARQVLNHVKGSGVSLSDAFPSLMLITTRLSSYVNAILLYVGITLPYIQSQPYVKAQLCEVLIDTRPHSA